MGEKMKKRITNMLNYYKYENYGLKTNRNVKNDHTNNI